MTPDQSTTPPPGDMVLTARGWLPRADVFTGFRTVETPGEIARHTERYDRLTGEYLGGECHVQIKKAAA